MSNCCDEWSDDDPRDETFSSTTWEVKRLKHFWKIENLEWIYDSKVELKSVPIAVVHQDEEYRFQFALRQNPDDEEYISALVLSLNKLNFDTNGISIYFKLEVASGCSDCIRVTSSMPWDRFSPSCLYDTKTVATAFEKTELDQSSRSVTIICYLEIDFPVTVTVKDWRKQNGAQSLHPNHSTLLQDVSNLFENHTLSDVVIDCASTKFHCHKAILGARSKVFKAMLTFGGKDLKDQESKEDNNESDLSSIIRLEGEQPTAGTLEIDIIKPEVMKRMIEFIYTDKVTDLEPYALEVFEAADMYDIPDLQAMCEKLLIQAMDKENVIRIAVSAHQHSAEQLESKALSFLSKNLTELSETEDWKNLMQIAPEVMERLVLTKFREC